MPQTYDVVALATAAILGLASISAIATLLLLAKWRASGLERAAMISSGIGFLLCARLIVRPEDPSIWFIALGSSAVMLDLAVRAFRSARRSHEGEGGAAASD